MKNSSTQGRWNGTEIAVIGMSGRFPGADNLDEFWTNLQGGVESISFFSEEELIQEGIEPGTVQHPNYIKANSVLNQHDWFDYAFSITHLRRPQ